MCSYLGALASVSLTLKMCKAICLAPKLTLHVIASGLKGYIFSIYFAGDKIFTVLNEPKTNLMCARHVEVCLIYVDA